ncbi:hypothetical protein NJL88_35070 [Streptomyces sp. DK15]|uniref:hypothetical protein n=1 Tax=Streptomyces sp. DK15 TaxID=2957499 RepID=UPI0029B9E95D|nr:hypothetical protein [Streptomyces sp. DK15]MDX2395189.1 hypothetical protein [Streptomyces sp. DK15]
MNSTLKPHRARIILAVLATPALSLGFLATSASAAPAPTTPTSDLCETKDASGDDPGMLLPCDLNGVAGQVSGLVNEPTKITCLPTDGEFACLVAED